MADRRSAARQGPDQEVGALRNAALVRAAAHVLRTARHRDIGVTEHDRLRGIDDRGFVFYTNLGSRKAGEINANPRVALLFYWPNLHRQVKILGQATRTTVADDTKYFLSRPRDSQLGAWVSDQSRVLTSRKALEIKLGEIKRKFGEGEVPLPKFWGGYRVTPATLEFWQGQPDRLHDRFQYTRERAGWGIQRLAP